MRKFHDNPVFIVHLVLWLLLSFQVIRITMPGAQHGGSFGIWHEPVNKNGLHFSVLKIVDFPSHFNFVRKAWLHQTTIDSGQSIYSVDNHLKVTSDWAGNRVEGSLPFGYSPTMLWLLAPLVPFSHVTAYFIFNIAGLLAVLWLTYPGRCRRGVGLLSFFSPLAQVCFLLGQTALLTGAGLLFLAEKTRGGGHSGGWRDPLVAGSVLWALTAKPPIALFAAVVLFGLREWKTLFVAAVLTIFSTAAIVPLMGSNWMSDYLNLLGGYNKTDIAEVFSSSIVPADMANLRSILNVDFGFSDHSASYISTITWLAVLGCIAIAGLRSRLSAVVLWSMGILSYILFCPHVSTTEELQVIVILSLCVSVQSRLSGRELVLFGVLPALVFISPGLPPLSGVRWPLFLIQLSLFFFFAYDKSFDRRDFTLKKAL